MKHSPLPPRKKALTRSTKPIRKVNPTAKAKRVAKQKAFYSSAAWKKIRKAALERAGNQCEAIAHWNINGEVYKVRCLETTQLQVHHKSYARFGGTELPTDLVCYCYAHHSLVEMRDHPTRHQR
jgi:hypothetical protein